MEKNIEHDINCLLFSDEYAAMSKDTSTKVGAIIIDEGEESFKSFGYNGMPRGLDDNNLERNERPEKYFWYEHAERNAIYNAARKIMQNAVMFCSHFPNMESARAIVSSGIKLVVTPYDKDFHDEYLKLRKNKQLDTSLQHKEYDRVKTLFSETKVDIHSPSISLINNGFFNNKHKNDEILKKSRKYLTYLNNAIKYGERFGKYGKKEGVLILNKDTFSPISSGLYEPPFGLKNISQERLNDEKNWFIEAPKNAIYNSLRPSLKNSAVYASWCPCMGCALAISAIGAKKVVSRTPTFETEAEKRWEQSFKNSMELFKDMQIETKFFTSEELINFENKKYKTKNKP